MNPDDELHDAMPGILLATALFAAWCLGAWGLGW